MPKTNPEKRTKTVKRCITSIVLSALCVVLLCGAGLVDGIPPDGELPPAEDTILGPDSDMTMPDDYYENEAWRTAVVFALGNTEPYWKEVIVLEETQTLSEESLPSHVVYQSRDGVGGVASSGIEMAWNIDAEELARPGPHLVQGTPILREGMLLEEGYDGQVLWPVFRQGEGAVLEAVPQMPVVTDPLMGVEGDLTTELAVETTSRRFFVGEDSYLDLTEDCLWVWDFSAVDTAVAKPHEIYATLQQCPQWIHVAERDRTTAAAVYVVPTDRMEIYAATCIDGARWLIIEGLNDCSDMTDVVLERQMEDGQWVACEKNTWYIFYTYMDSALGIKRGELNLNLLQIPTEQTHVLRLRYQDVVNGRPVERISESLYLTLPADIGQKLTALGGAVPPGITDGDRDGGDESGADMPDYMQPAPGDDTSSEPTVEVPIEDTTEAESTEAESTEVESTEAESTEAESTEAESTEAESTEAESTEAESTEAESTKAESKSVRETQSQPEEGDTSESMEETVWEVVTETYTAISGLRVSKLAMLGDMVLFEKQGVSVEIPSQLLLDLDLGEQELLEVTIERLRDDAFRLTVIADGMVLEEIGGTVVRLPWKSTESVSVECRDLEGTLVAEGMYRPEEEWIQFAITQPGTYVLFSHVLEETEDRAEESTVESSIWLEETQNAPEESYGEIAADAVQKNTSSAQIIGILVILACLAGIVWVVKKRID